MRVRLAREFENVHLAGSLRRVAFSVTSIEDQEGGAKVASVPLPTVVTRCRKMKDLFGFAQRSSYESSLRDHPANAADIAAAPKTPRRPHIVGTVLSLLPRPSSCSWILLFLYGAACTLR